MSEPLVRLAHLSDVHVTAPHVAWRLRDWCSKRLTGWANLRVFGRGRRFQQTGDVLAALNAELQGERRPDRIVFSGDATALGFPEETSAAVEALGVGQRGGLPGLAVPGNHDYYTPRDEQSGAFESLFAPWQDGTRVDNSIYPFAQRAGPLWLIGVNSCTGHRIPWNASGRVGAAQLDRLEKLLHQLDPGPRVLVTHYPVVRPDGKPEKRQHGLRDLVELIDVAKRGGVCLWLHGHQHRSYHVDDPAVAPFPVICVGSGTEAGRWGYNTYTVAGTTLQAERRVYDPAAKAFRTDKSFDLELRTRV